jgi:hypothetical protein
MTARDVPDTLELDLQAAGLDQAPANIYFGVVRRSRSGGKRSSERQSKSGAIFTVSG